MEPGHGTAAHHVGNAVVDRAATRSGPTLPRHASAAGHTAGHRVYVSSVVCGGVPVR